jgi:hypothetical protein
MKTILSVMSGGREVLVSSEGGTWIITVQDNGLFRSPTLRVTPVTVLPQKVAES